MSVISKKDSRIIVRTCRICLDAKSVDMVILEEQNGWLKRFEFCFGLTLTTQDTPRLLCQTCAEKVESYVKFKEKCHKSHDLWKSVISDVTCNIVKHEGFENLSTIKENDNDPVTNTTHIKNETFDSIFDDEYDEYDEYDDINFTNNDGSEIKIAEIKTVIDDDTKSRNEATKTKENVCIVSNKMESKQKKSKTVSSNSCVKSDSKEVYTCAICYCRYGRKSWYLKHIKVCRVIKNKAKNKKTKKTKKNWENPEYSYYLGRKYDDQNIGNDVKQELQNTSEIIGNELDFLLSCGLCNLSFADTKGVYKHLDSNHWSINDLACKLCDFVGVDLAAIISHRFSHLPRKTNVFVCHICEKPWHSLLTLHFHYRKEHLNKPGGFCSRCNREYSKQGLWRKHERMHADPILTCDICGKTFSYKRNLVDHMINHMQLDRCICDICGKVMSRQRNLNDHKEAVHSNAGPIKCEHCNRMFKNRFNLNLHMKYVNREKTLECEVCHKTYKNPNLLRLHKIVHTDERPYSCDLCEKSYKRKRQLTQHLQKHSGIVPQCLSCMKTFTTKQCLKRHAAVHTGVRKYTSTVASCERTFYAKKQMLAHLQLRHKNEILEKSQKSAATQNELV